MYFFLLLKRLQPVTKRDNTDTPGGEVSVKHIVFWFSFSLSCSLYMPWSLWIALACFNILTIFFHIEYFIFVIISFCCVLWWFCEFLIFYKDSVYIFCATPSQSCVCLWLERRLALSQSESRPRNVLPLVQITSIENHLFEHFKDKNLSEFRNVLL